MKAAFGLIASLALLTVSCGEFIDILFGTSSGGKTFWALDYTRDPVGTYRVSADLLASNELCEIWVHKGSGVDALQAQKVANEYKNNIYTKMMNVFGWEDENGYNIMDYADAYGDKNGKLSILLLDIKDGYKGGRDPYVAGYFYAYNFFDDNMSDIIFMDTYPSSVGSDEFYRTLAHEMQHLMNFITTIKYRSETNEKGEIIDLFFTDTWIDEGLSSAAEWVYSGKPDEDRIDWYNKDSTGWISKGDNFYVWDNHREDPRAVLNEYATVSIFFQWLRLHFSEDVYNKIALSEHSDYKAVEKSSFNWSELMGSWHAANYINNSSSYHGYKNESLLKSIKASYLDSDAKSWDLYPGEAVYTYSSKGMNTPGNSAYIKYMSISNFSGNVPAGGALLTYNVDTRNGLEGENPVATKGTIAGDKPPKIYIQSSANDSRTAVSTSQASYRIDAGDIIRRKGVEHDPHLRGAAGEAKLLPKISHKELVRYKADE